MIYHAPEVNSNLCLSLPQELVCQESEGHSAGGAERPWVEAVWKGATAGRAHKGPQENTKGDVLNWCGAQISGLQMSVG